MNILMLTLLDFYTIYEPGIYQDLMKEFIKGENDVYVISPVERKKHVNTNIIKDKKATILKLKIGNIQKTNLIEKGITTVCIEPIFISAIKKYFSNIKFDLVIYSTPPITFCNVVNFVKRRDHAKTYLLLKDIFPQNAVDMGMLSKNGIRGIPYKFFRKKEKDLYHISDHIGCMSQANVDYLMKHNPEIEPETIEICPNCIEIFDKSINKSTRVDIRKKYNIPVDREVFVYGGNLGKPQGIDFLIKCIYNQRNNKRIFFLIVGDGTEYKKIENFIQNYPQENLKLIKRLPKGEYDLLVAACDVGLIFLDYCFTIPNFPSRLLSYMQAKIPVLAVTDTNTDVGKVILEGDFGWWCESNDIASFENIVNIVLSTNKKEKAENAFQYLLKNYSADKGYKMIINHFI